MADAALHVGTGADAPRSQGISAWRRFTSDPTDWFTTDDIAKSKAYSTPSRRLNRAARAAALATEVAVVVGHLGPRIVDAVGSSNWVVQAIAITVVVALIDTAVSTPFSAYRQLSF